MESLILLHKEPIIEELAGTFILKWSEFEAVFLDKRGSVKKINKILNELELSEDLVLNETLDYLKRRYTKNSRLTERFAKLHLRSNDSPELVEKFLLSENITLKETYLTILIIMYRYRCNLAHGYKVQGDIEQQASNFNISIRFLSFMLEKYST